MSSKILHGVKEMFSPKSLPLSIKSVEEYRRYVKTYGKLPTKTFNDIVGHIESVNRGLYLLLMPPGSGKSFILFQLLDEFTAKGPVLFESFSNSSEKFKSFVNTLEVRLAQSIANWVHTVTGKTIGGNNPELLTVASAIAEATDAHIPLLFLLDEVPLEREESKLEENIQYMETFLRKADGLAGFKIHVVLTSHAISADLKEKLFDKLRERGGLQRYNIVLTFNKVELAPGFENEARDFVKKLAQGFLLDPYLVDTAVEMLKRGFVFRHVIRLIDGARRREASVDLERDLHHALVGELEKKLPQGKANISSRPDLVLVDGTCIEVKVRVSAPDINPLQHAECPKKLYIIVAPESQNIQGARVIHRKADVAQIVSALQALKAEDKKTYEGVLGILAQTIVTSILPDITQVPKPQPVLEDNRIRLICATLSQMFRDSKAQTRSYIAKSSVFKALLHELAPITPAEYKEQLEKCMKNPVASCVDLASDISEKVYGKTIFRIEGSKVYIGNFCIDQQF
jgi:hypothetical protein